MSDRTRQMGRTRRRRLIRRITMLILGLQGFVAAWISIRNTRSSGARSERAKAHPYTVLQFDPIPMETSSDVLRMVMTGDETVGMIIDAIEQAEREVLVETFIWAHDEVGRSVRDALVRAAERGVRVCVIYDSFGSFQVARDRGFFPPPIEAFDFHTVIEPFKAARLRTVLRDHRKVVTVDGIHAFCGGYNFGNVYSTWRDTHIALEGPCVGELRNTFVDFWNGNCPIGFRPIEKGVREDWDASVTVHRNDPSMAVFPIRGMYLDAIDHASERIWITNAYFVPDRAFRGALERAARRGVDIRIMLPRNSNHPMTDVFAVGMFGELLAAGARVFLFRDHMVHAKTATVDGVWSTVGTANLDRWSMLGNHEVNLEIRSPAFAQAMERMYLTDMEHCREVDYGQWRRRPLHRQAGELIIRGLAPLM